MYALSISCADAELQRALLDEAFGVKLHVDRGTQVDLLLLDRGTPSPQLSERKTRDADSATHDAMGSSTAEDEEVSDAVGVLLPGSSAGGPSRASGGTSPFWPIDEDDNRDAMWSEDDAGGVNDYTDERGIREEETCLPCESRPTVRRLCVQVGAHGHAAAHTYHTGQC